MSRPQLIIDGQLLQTTAWDRGMGHYCRSLLAAYAALDVADITIIFNEHLELSNERAEAIKHLLPQATVALLVLPTLSGDILASKQAATKVLDAFVASSFGDQPVHFLELQLFTFDYCAAFPTKAHKLVICYDLIPLQHWQIFSAVFAAHMYLPHLTSLIEADEVLAISETTKNTAVNELSLDPERVVNLKGAYIPRTASASFDGLPKDVPFILMPTADMPHKNNRAAVQAFAEFNRELGNVFKLVITSHCSDDTRRLLECYSDDLIFTGNVSDGELEYLYEQCSALLFVSSIEGLGLPILEAVHHRKPVVCSSIEVFLEISKQAFYYCDPSDPASIQAALRTVFGDSAWPEKLACYAAIEDEFSWQQSALRLQTAIEMPAPREHRRSRAGLLIGMPHPASTSTELGRLVQRLIPQFATYAELHVATGRDDYVDEASVALFAPYFAETYLAARPPSQLPAKAVYFIDHTSASADVVRLALLHPGLCYVTKHSDKKMLGYLADKGYITSDVAKAAVGMEGYSLTRLLEASGNVVQVFEVASLWPPAEAGKPKKNVKGPRQFVERVVRAVDGEEQP
ncbi:MAG: group 1 glycosyl transferase [Candidatus Saccharibacteria bacterium]|nr:group 1 glycosyl transferase [Candidatus Saccharibacteria bacterium]